MKNVLAKACVVGKSKGVRGVRDRRGYGSWEGKWWDMYCFCS